MRSNRLQMRAGQKKGGTVHGSVGCPRIRVGLLRKWGPGKKSYRPLRSSRNGSNSRYSLVGTFVVGIFTFENMSCARTVELSLGTVADTNAKQKAESNNRQRRELLPWVIEPAPTVQTRARLTRVKGPATQHLVA